LYREVTTAKCLVISPLQLKGQYKPGVINTLDVLYRLHLRLGFRCISGLGFAGVVVIAKITPKVRRSILVFRDRFSEIFQKKGGYSTS